MSEKTADSLAAVDVLLRIPDEVTVRNAVPYFKDPSFYLATITVLIALAGLLLPEIIRKVREKKLALESSSTLRTYIKSVIRSSSSTVERQLRAYRDFAARIRDIDSRDIALPDSHMSNLTQLLSLGHNKVFELYSEKQISQFQQLYESLLWIASQGERCKNNYDQYFSDLRRHELEFRAHLNDVFSRWDIIAHRAREQGVELDKIRRVFRQWQQSENAQTYSGMDNVLLSKLESTLKLHFEEKWAIELFRGVVNAREAIINLESTCEEYGVIFSREADELERLYSQLLSCSEILTERNM